MFSGDCKGYPHNQQSCIHIHVVLSRLFSNGRGEQQKPPQKSNAPSQKPPDKGNHTESNSEIFGDPDFQEIPIGIPTDNDEEIGFGIDDADNLGTAFHGSLFSSFIQY